MKRGNWNAFVSLTWYDSLIEFAFRFVAKTSEPLLAAGLVVSAADYLSHGAVMAGHPAFSLGWAWAQALALESSSGVVFVYALQAFRQADKIKGGIYLALALLLAIVGGGMLLLQVNAITMGSAETAVPVLNIMRVVVSIAYIFLLRAKSIRFSDLADVQEQVQVPMINPDVLNVLVERLENLSITVTQLAEKPAPALLAPQAQRSRIIYDEQGYAHLAPLEESRASEAPPVERLEPSQMEMHVLSQFTSKEQEVAAILARMPDASVEQVAQEAGCNVRTAEKWMNRLQEHERTN